MGKIIQREKSIIPSCDVDIATYERILKETSDLEAIGAYKIGFQLGLSHCLPAIVELTRKYTNKPLIYDHQKAGTDIPEMGRSFAKTAKNAGIDSIILVPQAGPETEQAWVKAAFDEGLSVIVGGLMTHAKYTQSRGGYISDDAVLKMYMNAAKGGVTEFVVPMNKPDSLRIIKADLESLVNPTFYMPGYSSLIRDVSNYAGKHWHAIIGRGLYYSNDIRKTVNDIFSVL